jgi:hypothetical protein
MDESQVQRQRELVARIDDIQQMVGYRSTVGHRGFGGSDVHTPVDLTGISIDDLSPNMRCQGDC